MDAKRKRKIWKITGITAGIIIVLVMIVLLSLGTIVKHSLTTIGPKVLGAPVKVGSVNINVFSGVVDIRDLFIGNPQGYKHECALTVKTIRVDIVPSSLVGKKMIVEEFTLDGVDVYFEPSATLLSNNLSQLNENVSAFSKKFSSGEAKTAAENKAEKKETKLQVDDLNLTSIFVNVVTSVPGGPVSKAPLPVVPIELENLGQDEDGITPLNLTAVILNKLTLGVFASVGDAFPSMKDFTDAGAKVLNTTTSIFKGMGELLKTRPDSGKK